jgi:integrase
MVAGSKGRRRNLKDAASFLTYGVDRCAMPDRYRPPSKSIIEELVGTGEFSAVELLTPALKPEQFTQLLDDLLHEGNQPLWLAVAACGYTGCRPSELATIKVKDGVAKVTSTKRNARNMKKPPKTRSVKPLEIPGRNHEGARVLALIEAGGEMGRFPKALKYQIERVMDPSHENHTTSFRDVGACFNQMLCRSKAWKKLMADENNRDLSPYSLRHGYSWRSTFGENAMPLRAAADLMGHDLGTHLRWYASWIDEKSSLDAVDRFNAKVFT